MTAAKKKKVVVGGTFDTIHEGHKALLKRAFELGRVTIGLTSDAMAGRTRKRKIRGFEQRKRGLESFLEKEMKAKSKIIRITDEFGPTLKEDFDYIVVSPATYPTAVLINRERRKRKIKPIKIVRIKFVLDKSGTPVSATRLLER
jgi:pantetheine-phosphate adenylyltransferase